jgi:hypothetical protein
LPSPPPRARARTREPPPSLAGAVVEQNGDSEVVGHQDNRRRPDRLRDVGLPAGDLRLLRERELDELVARRDESADRLTCVVGSLLVELDDLLLDRVRPAPDPGLEAHRDLARHVPGLGRHHHGRTARLPRVFLVAEEVLRAELGGEADVPLLVLDEH